MDFWEPDGWRLIFFLGCVLAFFLTAVVRKRVADYADLWRSLAWRAFAFGAVIVAISLVTRNFVAVVVPLGIAVFAFPPLWDALARRGLRVPVWARWLGALGVFGGFYLALSLGLANRPEEPLPSAEAQATDEFLADVAQAGKGCADTEAVGYSAPGLTNPVLNMWADATGDLCDQAARDLRGFTLPAFVEGAHRTELAKALENLAAAYSARALVFHDLAKATSDTVPPGVVQAALDRARAVPVAARIGEVQSAIRAASPEGFGPGT